MQNSKGEYLVELPPVCDQSALLEYYFFIEHLGRDDNG